MTSDVELQPSLSATLDTFFQAYYRLNPVTATFTGLHEHDARLPDWSMDGLEGASSELRALRTRFGEQGVAPRSNLAEWPVGVDAGLADAHLEIQLAELAGTHFLRRNPALYTGEAVFAAVSLMLREFAPAAERASNLRLRLGEIPTFLRTAQHNLSGQAIPRGWLERADEECAGAAALLDGGLQSWSASSGLDPDQTAALFDLGVDAAGAFDEFAQWLKHQAPSPEGRAGCGEEFYDLLLRRGHWLDAAAEDLLVEASERFDDAAAHLKEMTVAYGGWPNAQAKLAKLHPNAEDYLDAFQRVWNECRASSVNASLVTWPDYPISYVPMPQWAREAAPSLYFLHYRSPAPFDRVTPVSYLVPWLDRHDGDAMTSTLRAANDSVIKLNHVVHHGALGHHVQNYYAYRSPSRMGQVAAVDCASRIAMFCGGTVAEGWACYATDLMDEFGLLTKLERAAEQHSRLRQLARAIVDIRLHRGDMSESDAVEFYERRALMSAAAARKEVTRTSMFPGTAIMYWLGTKGIHDLRATRQAAEGPHFSLGAFHDEFLSYGSIPVSLITRLMSEAS